MRFVALALVLLSLPLFITLLRQNPHRRPWAFAAISLMLFLGSAIRISAYLASWPLWNGVARGMAVSLIETLALALVLTRRRLPGRLPFWPVFALYALPLLLSIVVSSVPMASLFVFWQYGLVVLLFAAIGGEIHREDMRRGMLTGLALGLMLQAGYVAAQKAGGMVQAHGTMTHQNVLGMMTELALLMLLTAMLGGDRRKVVMGGVVAGLFVIAGGGSRGALLFAGVGVGVLLLLSLARSVTPAKARVVGVAVLALAVAAPVAYFTLKDRFGGGSVVGLDDQRAAFARSARAMAADNPFGVGANLYVTIANTKGYAERAGVAWNTDNRAAPVHNAYLLARAETGWLGEIGLIALLAVPMAWGLLIGFRRRQGAAGEAALGSAVALGVNLVHNNFEYVGLTYGVQVLLVMNIGIIAAQIRAERHLKVRRAAPERQAVLRPEWAASRAA